MAGGAAERAGISVGDRVCDVYSVLGVEWGEESGGLEDTPQITIIKYS